MDRRRIWVERRKWRDIPHYGHEGWLLGEDEHGVWIELRAGVPVYRGADVLFLGPHRGVMLAPRGSGWLAWFPSVTERFSLYVDIVCEMTHALDAISMIDLDLDVIRYADGRVALVDEDEFELHQRELGYPADVIAAAQRSAHQVLEAVVADAPPFDGSAAARWAKVVERALEDVDGIED